MIQIRVGRRYAQQTKDPKHFFRMVRNGFSQRRKMLVNVISTTMGYSKEMLISALHELELSEKVRIEQLSMEQLVGLSNLLCETDPT